MKVLIFGSKGFIGRNLTERLSVHNEVFTSDLLEGNPINLNQKPSLGCNIKWKN